MFERIKTVLQNLFSDEESGIKVVGNYWFTRHSNAFKDREGEFFPVKAIDAYVDRVDTGVIPPPELWVWHTPIVLGKAKMVARVGLFVVAAGEFADTPIGQAAKAYLSKHKAKLSHGFVFEKETFKDNAYHNFNTFEISILPFNQDVEANAYTNIEVKDMAISKDKEKFLAEMFGDETAKELVANTDKASKALEELGVQFKDFADIAALKGKKPTGKAEDDEDAKKPPFMDDDESEGDDEEDEDEKAFKALVADNVASIAEVADYQLNLTKAVKAIRADVDAKLATANKQLAALRQENKALRDELKLTPRGTRASESDDTEVEDDDEAAADLKKKEEGEADDFWKFAKSKK
jgi:hypothetical protein